MKLIKNTGRNVYRCILNSLQVYQENNNDTGVYLDLGLLIVFDVDGDTLSVNTTLVDVNGTFTLIEASVSEMTSTVGCRNSMVGVYVDLLKAQE